MLKRSFISEFPLSIKNNNLKFPANTEERLSFSCEDINDAVGSKRKDSRGKKKLNLISN